MNSFIPIEILLVEDNPNDAKLVVRALTQSHLANRVEIVEDGAEALDLLFHRGNYSDRPGEVLPKVVFLDLKLPKVSGLEVLAEIRSHAATKKLPVVIVTSSKEDPDINTAYELGANSYIVKPVDFDAFFKAISELGMYWLALNEPPRINI